MPDSLSKERQSTQPLNPKPNKPRDAILVPLGEPAKQFPISCTSISPCMNDKSEEQAEEKRQVMLERSMPCEWKGSSLRVMFVGRRKKEDVQYLLRDKLFAFVSDIEEIRYEHAQITSSIVIHFVSDVIAIKALKLLRGEGEISSVEVVQWIIDRIEGENAHCLDTQHEKIERLQANLMQLEAKNKISLSEYERFSAEKEALKMKIAEFKKQREEFVFVHNQLAFLSPTIEVSLLNNLEIKMLRERNHLISALPIYARRSDIVETVLSSNVTVLVGETGSGKSTQVVQYLYDAGVAERGLIVCTQPRKVAAISLAKHVSREMHVNLGEELGYRVGMNEKCSKNTKILYVTDHILLNECVADRALLRYSCVLIDEAHERNINTDMLLAFVKQYLLTRNDLKLVIMSATIEPELFLNYFEHSSACEQECNTVSTITVSGRTFPVEVEYDPLHSREGLSPETDYVMNAVDVVRTIHANQPPGDILVFLTCAPEIERACRAVEYLQNEAIVLPLHGKLPPEEQQKVFDDSSPKRRIIFSTNVAETSVTIPGVKYVVDTGLAKEMHFDSRKSMDALEVCMISKSSAEQRKGRAGRVSSGKCYRLYTENDYMSKMPDRTKPEILRIQLSQVVLKMLEFGVPEVLKFDFVEHPDPIALEAAFDILTSVGAIQNNTLTDTGKKMAVLPLQPQLSKVLLDAVAVGLGTEALISVALSSLAGQVFYRGGTDEMKDESDKKKLTFCHQMGDQITSLSVYKCWQEQERTQRNKWCLQNYVNAKSMRVVEEMVRELKHIMEKKLQIRLHLNLESLEAAECYLGKLYFDAFINNLAVYLGHQRAGYMTTVLPNGSSFLIFPGSSLNHLGSTPKYVIYERTLRTSCQFLTQVMCVKQEWVNEAITMGRLVEDPAVTFAEHMCLPVHAVFTGPQTLKEIKFNQKKILQLVEVNIGMCSVPPVFDFSPEPKQWGVVRVVAQRKYHNAVQLALTGPVRELQRKMKKETKEFGLTKEQDWTRMVIGEGGTVQQIIMPYHFHSVIAVCSDETESPDRIKACLEEYGEVKTIKVIRRHPGEFRLCVTYSTSSQAKRAINEFSSPNLHLYPLKGQQFTIRLQWERRERGPHALVSFDSPQHRHTAHVKLGSCITYLGSRINISCDKYSQNKLFMSGDILCHITEDQLYEVIGINVSSNFSLKMGYRRYSDNYPYLRCSRTQPRNVQSAEGNQEDSESTSEEDDNVSSTSGSEGELEKFQQYIEENIRRMINNYMEHGTFRVKFLIPRERDVCFKAYVTFDDPDEGYKVLYSDLKNETILGRHLCVSPNLKCLLSFKQEVYTLIRDDVEKVRKHLIRRYSNLLYIKVIPQGIKVKDLTQISLVAYDVKVFSLAQNMLHQAAKPFLLQCNTTELQEYILSHECYKHLQATKKTTSTYICRDLNMMVIKIYGMSKNQKVTKAMIEEKARQLFSDGALVTQLSLRGDGKPPGLMKFLVTQYGCDLSGMLELKGVRRITLNPHFQSISILVTGRGLDAVRRCIEQASSSSMATVRKIKGEYEFDCSACFTPIDEPRDMFHLECCGHAFHIDCIEIQLKPNTITFPIQCAKEGCSEDFVLKDFDNLQKRLKMFRMPDLVSAALQNFMEKNGDFYKNCPTPDCKMIYTQTDSSKEFVCSSCSVSTCSKCHEQYHAGISCKVYNDNRRNDEELLRWMGEDPENRKKCPQCQAPIEKNEGCQHMKCTCGAHICWRCLKYFKTATKCYDHQPFCPALSPPPIHHAPITPVINPAPPITPQVVNRRVALVPAPVNARAPPIPTPVQPTHRSDGSCNIL